MRCGRVACDIERDMAQSYWRRSDHSLECELILDVGSVIVLSNTAFGAARGDFGRYGNMFIMTGQKEFENNADDRNPCSEDKHVRSEGRNGYWRRHHDDLRCGFFFPASSNGAVEKGGGTWFK